GDQFLVWGWRIPFLLSIGMVAVGLWIRFGILETPVFRRVLEENRVARAPTIEVFRKQPKEIVLTALLRLAEQSPGYIFNAFIFTYGTQVLGASRDLLLIGLITTTALGLSGHRSPVRYPTSRPPADVHHRLSLRRDLPL